MRMKRFSPGLVSLILLGFLGLFTFIRFYDEAFPTASIDFKVSRAQAKRDAGEFLRSRGFGLEGYESCIIFSHDGYAQIYMEKTLGLREANKLMSSDVSVWYWQARWFKPLQKEEFEVYIDPRGRVVGFSHLILEDAEGANLARSQALRLASEFLAGQQGIDPGGYELVESASEKRKQRTDHYFQWKRKDFEVGEATYRLSVQVQGDIVGSYDEFLKVPEDFKRDYRKTRSRAGLLGTISESFQTVLFVGLIIAFMFKFRTGDIRWRFALALAVAVVIPTIAQSINSLPLARSGFPTEATLANSIAGWVTSASIAALLSGLYIWFVGSTGESMYREVYRENLPSTFTLKHLGSQEFFISSLVGYALAFAFLGYLVGFYLAGEKFLGVWSPAHPPYDNIVSTSIPWIYPLTIGVSAAISEEFFFRLFAISFLKKYLKKTFLALLIPAMIWAFAHSFYAVEPIYIRGVELTIAGVAIGWVFLRFGIFAVLIAHYVINAMIASLPLLRSTSPYFFISGLLVVGLMLIPIIWVATQSIVRKTCEVIR